MRLCQTGIDRVDGKGSAVKAGDADILLQARKLRNARNRGRYGAAQDVGQQLMDIQPSFDERTADDHLPGDHADPFFLGQAEEALQVFGGRP